MKLIDIYVQEVTRRLPEKIVKTLPSSYDRLLRICFLKIIQKKDVKAVLEEMGNPAFLARSYHDWPQHLIGPRYFNLYITLLKMALQNCDHCGAHFVYSRSGDWI